MAGAAVVVASTEETALEDDATTGAGGEEAGWEVAAGVLVGMVEGGVYHSGSWPGAYLSAHVGQTPGGTGAYPARS